VEEEPTLGKLISPCKCKGSVKFIHEECLKTWILEKQGIEDALEDSVNKYV
jgi:E3 ubiquitin-protein ligase MARCH1/8